MTKLILVRHGETETNIKGKIHQYSDSEELTSHGITQIEKTSQALRKYQPTLIYSSKETRAVQSATIISVNLNIPLVEMSGLAERNWGDFAGLTFTEIQQKAGLDTLSFEERYTLHPPSGESWKEAEERLLNALHEILSKNENKCIVLVTHGGSIRILIPTLLGIGKEESYIFDPGNASISIFDYQDGKFSTIVYNDTSHLKD